MEPVQHEVQQLLAVLLVVACELGLELADRAFEGARDDLQG